MTLERKWGAIFCLVGAFLLFMLIGPLADTRIVFALWALAVGGGVVAVAVGLWLIVTGKPDASET
jgi:hypothetical protein